MRQMDEITERPAARPLPAPSGPRSPTGPVPLIAPANAIPPPADAALLVPYLPAAAPKSSTPTTGQHDITGSIAATLGIANPAPVAAPTPEKVPGRARKRLIKLAIVLSVLLLLGVVFRHSAIVERLTGTGYDSSNPLPTHSFVMPELASADYTFTFDSINVAGGVASHLSQTDHDEVNFTTGVAKLSINSAVSPIVDGKIGSPLVPTPPKEVLVDRQWTYQQGAVATDPWVRTPIVPGSRAAAVLSRSDIRMYQDVIDPLLRSQQPATVVDETRNDVDVTTYTYAFALGDFYESAPRLFEWARSMEGNASDDAPVTVTISLDEQMIVRYLDVNLDYSAVIDHVGDDDDLVETYRYRSTFELTSTADAAATVEIPPNAVDPTTTAVPVVDSTTSLPETTTSVPDPTTVTATP